MRKGSFNVSKAEKVFDLIGEICGIITVFVLLLLAFNAQFGWLAVVFDYLGVQQVSAAVRTVWLVAIFTALIAVICSGMERMVKRGLVASAVFAAISVVTIVLLAVNCGNILAI